jgi:DNA-directed RNA polymerase subunit L
MSEATEKLNVDEVLEEKTSAEPEVIEKVEEETKTSEDTKEVQPEAKIDESELETLFEDEVEGKQREDEDLGSFKSVKELKKGYLESSKEGMKQKKRADAAEEALNQFNAILAENKDLYDQLKARAQGKGKVLEESKDERTSKVELPEEDRIILDALREQQKEKSRTKVLEFAQSHPKFATDKELRLAVKKTAQALLSTHGKPGQTFVDYLDRAYVVEDPTHLLEKERLEAYVQAHKSQNMELPGSGSSAPPVTTGKTQYTAAELAMAEKCKVKLPEK